MPAHWPFSAGRALVGGRISPEALETLLYWFLFLNKKIVIFFSLKPISLDIKKKTNNVPTDSRRLALTPQLYLCSSVLAGSRPTIKALLQRLIVSVFFPPDLFEILSHEPYIYLIIYTYIHGTLSFYFRFTDKNFNIIINTLILIPDLSKWGQK